MRACAHTHTQTKIKIDKQMDTKKKKNVKNQHFCQCWSPIYSVFVLFSRCGECHPKGLIVAS